MMKRLCEHDNVELFVACKLENVRWLKVYILTSRFGLGGLDILFRRVDSSNLNSVLELVLENKGKITGAAADFNDIEYSVVRRKGKLLFDEFLVSAFGV